MNDNTCESLLALRSVLEQLTGEQGCPWDKVQTPRTLADYLVEESHELAAAIRSENPGEIRGELGDICFLLLFVAQYYAKQGSFTLADALDEIRLKMIRRHPHVFGDTRFASLDEQLKAWEKIKKAEKSAVNAPPGLFASLPSSLPALIKAYRIHSKAARAGFTWQEDEAVEQQAESEWLEWLDACQSDDRPAQEHELGDMLFTLVELGRRRGIKANDALEKACARFLDRYALMEEMARARGQDLTALDIDEQDRLWEHAKEALQGPDAQQDS